MCVVLSKVPVILNILEYYISENFRDVTYGIRAKVTALGPTGFNMWLGSMKMNNSNQLIVFFSVVDAWTMMNEGRGCPSGPPETEGSNEKKYHGMERQKYVSNCFVKTKMDHDPFLW